MNNILSTRTRIVRNAWGIDFPGRNDYFKIDGVEPYLRQALVIYLKSIGCPQENVTNIIDQIIVLATEEPNHEKYLRALRGMLCTKQDQAIITESRDQRAANVVTQISQHLDTSSSMLDLGCGDGVIAAQIKATTGWSFVYSDIFETTAIANAGFEFILIESETVLPMADSSYSTVLLASVAHHAKKPIDLLKEAVRVLQPGGTLLMIEILFDSLQTPEGRHFWSENMTKRYTKLGLEARKAIACFMDEIANTVGWSPDICHPINCPLNFNTVNGWTTFLNAIGIQNTHIRSLGVDQPLGAGICHGLIKGTKP